MKQYFKLLIAFIAISISVTNLNGQESHSATETTVNIILADVISIDNGSVAAGGVVDLNFMTAEHYNEGRHADVPNSLIVTSTKPFDIIMKAGGFHFINGSNTIPVDVLNIEPIGGSISDMETGLTLSRTSQVLASHNDPGSKISLDLQYRILGSVSSSPDILGKPAGTYTQTVTYTATAL